MGDEEPAAGERFEKYLQRLAEAAGHADRRAPLRAYVTGLLLSGERKRQAKGPHIEVASQ